MEEGESREEAGEWRARWRACNGNTDNELQVEGGRAVGGEEDGWQERRRMCVGEDGGVCR